MGVIDRLFEGRALKAADALLKAETICARRRARCDVSIAEFEGRKRVAEQDFYAAHDKGNTSEEQRCLSIINAIDFSIRTLERDRENWSELGNILLQIEVLINALREQKKYWTIVRAIPYRKLQAEDYDISTVESLIADFEKAYKQLNEYSLRLRRKSADFDKALRQTEQTYENRRFIDEQMNPTRREANEDLMRQLLERRDANSSSNVNPVDRTDDDDNVAPA